MTIDTSTTIDRTEEATGAIADRVFASVLGALDILTIHIGDQLGLYDLLHRRGPLDVAEVAAASGTHPRYAREWLEQQAVAGLIDVIDPTVGAGERRYWLSDAHAAVLCDRDSLAYTTPFHAWWRRPRCSCRDCWTPTGPATGLAGTTTAT